MSDSIPKSTLDSVCASSNFREKEVEVRLARARREAAGYALELAEIRYRCAELRSQHEPLARLLLSLGLKLGDKGYEQTRHQLFCAASYAVYGRLTGQ